MRNLARVVRLKTPGNRLSCDNCNRVIRYRICTPCFDKSLNEKFEEGVAHGKLIVLDKKKT